MRESSPGQAKGLAQGHTALEQHSWNENPGSFASLPLFFSLHPHRTPQEQKGWLLLYLARGRGFYLCVQIIQRNAGAGSLPECPRQGSAAGLGLPGRVLSLPGWTVCLKVRGTAPPRLCPSRAGSSCVRG